MTSLKQKLYEQGIESSMLDDLVQDAASQKASSVNNEGMAEQLRFLEDDCGWSEQEILAGVCESDGDSVSGGVENNE